MWPLAGGGGGGEAEAEASKGSTQPRAEPDDDDADELELFLICCAHMQVADTLAPYPRTLSVAIIICDTLVHTRRHAHTHTHAHTQRMQPFACVVPHFALNGNAFTTTAGEIKKL